MLLFRFLFQDLFMSLMVILVTLQALKILLSRAYVSLYAMVLTTLCDLSEFFGSCPIALHIL